ncbi:MAG: efflux RND transporter periplasmic adaptor subunit [Betaproteobacteria bacterium]|nr:efflux RND transporter periplasmic adaptor subunit [Betaproteobacteria bacterium]
MKLTLAALTVIVVAGSLIAWRASSATKDEKKPAETVLEFAPADLFAVEQRSLSRTLPFSGSLSPLVQATVKSKVSGTVQTLLVREGQRVGRGQIIAEIDTLDAKARLDAQIAALEEAKAKWTIAQKTSDSNLQLLKQNFISQNAFDTTHSTLEAAAAAVRSAEAQLRIAQNAMQDAVIRSPIDGILAKRMVNGGEKVGPDSPMFAVVDLTRMEIEAPAAASEIPGIKVGQLATFKVDGYGERKFEARVERINPVTEQGSRSIILYLSVDNRDGALKGGMFAKGSLVLDKAQPAAVIPLTALRDEAGQPFVFTLEAGKIGRRNVTLGMREEQAGMVEVKTGVEQGLQVVSARMVGLKAGASALIKAAAPAPAPVTPVSPVKAG